MKRFFSDLWDIVYSPLGVQTAIFLFVVVCGVCFSSCGNSSSKSLVSEEYGTDLSYISMKPVDSTMAEEIGYDSDSEILLIRFRSSGALYAYYEVPKSEYYSMLASDSIGGYFNSSIKGNYVSEKIDDGSDYEVSQMFSKASYEEATYAVNTGTCKFHSLDCEYADSDNIVYTSDSRDELIGYGYKPCKVCNP